MSLRQYNLDLLFGFELMAVKSPLATWSLLFVALPCVVNVVGMVKLFNREASTDEAKRKLNT